MDIAERTFSPATAFTLAKAGTSPLLGRILASRGIRKPSEISGVLEDLLPFSSLKGCQDLAVILAEAILANKRLLVVADYDADGATACAVAVRALRAFGADVDFLIPKRLEHGYGLTPEIAKIAAALTPKPDFLITVDNGIASHAGIFESNLQGVPVLVTDHHLPADGMPLPAARAVVNPNQDGCSFSSKSLAGVGVIWYVMRALEAELAHRGIDPVEDGFTVASLLPIVAIGTVADVVALDRNNRILVNTGLDMIHKGQSFPGIEALATVLGRNSGLMATGDIAFGLGPCINAAGRLESMDAGVECLTTESSSRAQDIAVRLKELNEKRKNIESTVVTQAVDQLLSTLGLEGKHTVVLHQPEWHEGVIGIASGRVRERTYRPTFILTTNAKGEIKGSGRSIPGFHLRDALDMVAKRNPNILLRFGGHAAAAGLTLKEGTFELFKELFEEVAIELLTPALLNQVMETDGALDSSEMSLETVAEIKSYVWGQAFPEPTFADEFRVVEWRKRGDKGQHLSLTLEKDGRKFSAMKFRNEAGDIPPRIKAVFKLDANTFRDNTSLQLLIDYFEPIEFLDD
jgi:single-stranded-DNA-specific exonuclease